MSKFNKSYRIRTNVNEDTQVHVKLDQDYDVLEIMSLKINQINDYKLHTSTYGVVAGRVLANDAFGIPNAKVSIFIQKAEDDNVDVVKEVLYPYNSTHTQDKNGTRYNLLPNEQLSDCHTIIGTFPEKQYLLDNESILEVFEQYYKFTTRTNNAGDYMIFGIPTGNYTIHVDIDLSDIGILSQKPRDMFYKGYNVEAFENPNKFKYDTNLETLVQVISQDTVTNVIPFWGDTSEGSIGITRCDINVQYKFEPTCVFIGSVVSDTTSNGISKKCIPTPGMGAMDDLVTGSGTIEMIRKTPSGGVEEYQIKGNQLINGNGVWCYQIPMNLDYMMTDEFGNMVPTNHPEKGIPTRTRVRFRLSLQDFENTSTNFMRGKVLIPHNPNIYGNSTECEKTTDYVFGTNTNEDSYRDLFWNGVYSVKSYIPRIQKGDNWKHEKFTGFKRVNYYGDKNPLPYNNIRIKIPFAFTIMCILIKSIIRLTGFLNRVFRLVGASFVSQKDEDGNKKSGAFLSISGEMCNSNLEFLCLLPGVDITKIVDKKNKARLTLLGNAIIHHYEEVGGDLKFLASYVDDSKFWDDPQSIEDENKNKAPAQDSDSGVYGSYTEMTVKAEEGGKKNDKRFKTYITGIRVTDKMDYLLQCIEMNLAQEYRVIQFDFYNDWINGVIYIPRWMRTVTKKRTFKFFGRTKEYGGKVKACNDTRPNKKINLVQQCGLTYSNTTKDNMQVATSIGCKQGKDRLLCHKSKEVRKRFRIFQQSGLVHTQEANTQTSAESGQIQYAYYFKPVDNNGNKNVRLFATDIILLGTLNSCDMWGIPGDLTELVPSTYQMPTNLALTDSDLEGNDYESKIGENKSIYIEVLGSKARIDVLQLGGCYVGINPFEEDANYTELSGVSWVYNGPLQTIKVPNVTASKLYKPGGHFLGLTCRNSETTIKSCVNLSRICEHGVWMSQRHELNIPNPNATDEDNAFLNYATVPTGVISKDEISDTNYRRTFASLNKNRLRTRINPETGYPIYDFEYVNPTNFGGELKPQLLDDTKDSKYLNRKVHVLDEEHYYEYLDDDNYVRGNKEVYKINPETQIMRTGEFSDSEYLKFRFGFTDSDFNNGVLKTNSRKTRFLLSDSKGISFPIYDNSFYFYFGLQPGNTALDEFKKTYYANCSKTDLFAQNLNNISLLGLTSEYDGLNLNNKHYGSIHYDSIAADESLFKNGLTISLFNEDNTLIKTFTQNDNSGYTFTGLSTGEYKLVIKSSDEQVKKEIPISVGVISFNMSFQAISFNKDVSSNTNIEKFQDYDSREKLGGYIVIPNNIITYKKSDTETEEINIFTDACISKYVIRGSIDNTTIQGDKTIVKYSGYEKTLREDSDGNYMIPVPKENDVYTIEVYAYIGADNKPISTDDMPTSREQIIVKSTGIVINNGVVFNFAYNDVSFKDTLFPYINFSTQKITDIEGWWSKPASSEPNARLLWDSEEDRLASWNIKKALYMTHVGDNNNCHNVAIRSFGGNSPHVTELTYYEEGNLSNKVTATNNLSALDSITIPTINYKNNVRRNNFAYQVTDGIGQKMPVGGQFIFPVIYKPFFMEMALCSYEGYDDVYLCGNVYNGRTWIETEGFNNTTLNGQKLLSITTTTPDTILSLNEVDSNGNTITGGGLNYNGPLYKYNGRKITVTRSINSLDIFNLNTNGELMTCDLKVGVLHTDNSIPYTDSTEISDNKMALYKFAVTSTETNDNYSFKVDVKQTATDLFAKDYKVYALISENGTANGYYPYPFDTNTGKPTIHNTKLFRHIMDGTLKDIFGENGSIGTKLIKINDKSVSGKKVYCIAMPDYDESMQSINKTVNDNIIKSVSISKLIDVSTLNKFYPLALTASGVDKLDSDGNYTTTITFAEKNPSINNVEGKRFTFRFYSDNKGTNLLYTISLTPNTDKKLVWNITDYERQKLEIKNDSSTSNGATKILYFDYDATIISDNISSPSSYDITKCTVTFSKTE